MTRHIAVFLVLAFALSWAPWLAVLATTGDATSGAGAAVLWGAGGFGPALAAVVAARRGGAGRWGELAASLRRWRVGAWYVTLPAMLPLAVLAVLGSVLANAAPLDTSGLSQWYLLPGLVAVGIVFGGLEEIGWRGYLQPELQRSLPLVRASILVGLVWAAWHAPLFLMENTSQANTSFGWFSLQAVGLSVVLGWIYDRTRSTFLLVALHGAVNGSYGAAVLWLAPESGGVFMPYAAALFAVLAVVVAWNAHARRPSVGMRQSPEPPAGAANEVEACGYSEERP